MCACVHACACAYVCVCAQSPCGPFQAQQFNPEQKPKMNLFHSNIYILQVGLCVHPSL